MKNLPVILLSGLVAVTILIAAETSEEKKSQNTSTAKIVKSDDEWKKLLTDEQFRVTRKSGTERPFGESYKKFKQQGEGHYLCVCCGAKLFSSNEKFDSGCGWPSFYDKSKGANVKEKLDESLGMRRIEVTCGDCDAHLGHVFEGEGFATPTDRRFCINAAAMKFVSAEELEKETAEKENAAKATDEASADHDEKLKK